MNSTNTIRLATPEEAPLLSDLAFASKAYWGYPPEFMEDCREELQVDPADCKAGLVTVTEEENGIIAGYYRLAGQAPIGELADLFIQPEHIGSGIGKELLLHATSRARMLGMTALEIHADPHAEGFYSHLGAERIGFIHSGSISGRLLPKLLLRIDN